VSWIGYSLRRGILTTRYPAKSEAMPPGYRGAVEPLVASAESQRLGAEACLTNAIEINEPRARIEAKRCFQCGECARRAPAAFKMLDEFELAEVPGDPGHVRELLQRRVRALGRSIHLRHVDAGSDGSEEQELQAIFNPFYDANRLGIFLTAAPRHADLLAVSGAVTHRMLRPLRLAYDAMPEPKLVIALGTAACSGGIVAGAPPVFGTVADALPVSVFVPGSPPAPLTILHGLLVALGRIAGRKEA
jgi:Ni,Fe-hydrogenase III small subunit